MVKIKKCKVKSGLGAFFMHDFVPGEEVFVIQNYSDRGHNFEDKKFIDGVNICINVNDFTEIGEIPTEELELIDYEVREEFESGIIKKSWFRDQDYQIKCVIIGDGEELMMNDHVTLEQVNRELAAIGKEKINNLKEMVIVVYDGQVVVKGERRDVKRMMSLPRRSILSLDEVILMEDEHEKDVREFNDYKKGV